MLHIQNTADINTEVAMHPDIQGLLQEFSEVFKEPDSLPPQ